MKSEKLSRALGNSTQEHELLRAAAAWAADYAEQALSIFESLHPDDTRPREAIVAGREFGQGKKRDQNLRKLALAAFKAGKGIDEPSKYAARAASLTAAVAYTHTDLQAGIQGIRQAQHVLGPAVYAALALETAANGKSAVGDDVIRRAVENAPSEIRRFVTCMPPQEKGRTRQSELYVSIDSALRN